MGESMHDWPAVYAALSDLLETSRDEEPEAVVFHTALETVIGGLPDAAFN